MVVHVAYMTPVGVNRLGQIVNKNDAHTTLKDVMTATSEVRVVPNPSVPSTGNPAASPPTTYPTLEEYLAREAAAGFKASFVSATIVITYDT